MRRRGQRKYLRGINFSSEPHQYDIDKIKKAEFNWEKPAHRQYMLLYHINYWTICDEGCLDVHDDYPIRRKPERIPNGWWNYDPELCEDDWCEDEKWRYAHTDEENAYHPMVYKTILCERNKVGQWPMGQFDWPCAHGEDDLRQPSTRQIIIDIPQPGARALRRGGPARPVQPPMLTSFDPATYKTVKCPINPPCYKPDWLHYHDHGDRRRNPQQYVYSSQLCQQLRQNRRCREQDNCQFAHSMFEIDFHPDMYMSKIWDSEKTMGPCAYSPYCPFIHNAPPPNPAGSVEGLILQQEQLQQAIAEARMKILAMA